MEDVATLTMLGPGAVVNGRFEVGEVAGAGGGGIVYRGIDRESGDAVAIKLLRDGSASAVARFTREAEALASLDHPAVVRHVAHGVAEGGMPFLAMEWLDGERLSERIAKGALGVDETLTLGIRLAEALAAAHAAGLLHRDVKPSNVVLVGGRLDRPRLIDFGLARSESELPDVTVSGHIVGTPAYMAPEQARGRRRALDPRVDVFALGAVLWECLTGRRAFEGERAVEVLAAVMSHDPPPASTFAPSVPGHFDHLLTRMLAKDPSRRPPDGDAVRLALELLRPSPTPAEGSPEVVRRAVLPGPPELAWALLVDTNRWDRIAGAPPTEYTHDDPATPRTGHAAIAGVPSVWSEVGEWVEGRWAWGERRFSTGPFTLLAYRFRCEATADGDTEVEVRAWATAAPDAPGAAAAMMAAHFEGRLAKYLAALDRFLGDHAPAALDPREPPAVTARRLLHRTTDRVLVGPTSDTSTKAFEQRARSLPPDWPAAAQIAELVSRGPDAQVRQMRPRELARALGADPEDMLRAFFAATDAGLVDMQLQLDCPVCRVAAQIVPTADGLDGLSREAQCVECDRAFELDLADNVELVFHPNATVREVGNEVWCAGSPVFRPHVFALLRLDSREQRSVETRFPPGAILARVRGMPATDALVPCAGVRVRVTEAAVTLAADAADGEATLVNETDRAIEVQLERAGEVDEITTFAEALSHPELHRHVRSAAAGELGRAFVVVAAFSMPDLRSLCEALGDGPALEREREAARAVAAAVTSHRGAVVHEQSGRWLACFRTEEDARAALEAAGPDLRGAIRAGPCIVARGPNGVFLFGATISACTDALSSPASDHDRVISWRRPKE